MEKISKLGIGAIICTLMLVSTGLATASKTTTTQMVYISKQQIRERLSAFNMTNNTKEQLIRVLSLVAVTAIGGLLVFKLRTFKVLSALILGVIIGFDTAVGTALIFHMQRAPQNETNKTL
jgi:hypothetical protein